MYIAQRWLFAMVLIMWIGLCSFDILYLKDSADLKVTEYNKFKNLALPVLKNSSLLNHQRSFEKKVMKTVYYNKCIVALIAGVALILIYYRNCDFLLCTIIKIKLINTKYKFKKHLSRIETLKITAKTLSVAILKFTNLLFLGICRSCLLIINKQLLTPKRNSNKVNLLLLNKLKEYSEERRNFGHVLFATIQENKNIRKQYQLEVLAKNRFLRQVEEARKQIKINRSRCISFQQLYSVVYQENNFLKFRIKKLAQDKEEADKNLIKLVNCIWQTKNNELKTYCSLLLFKNKNYFINSNAEAEVDQFLKRSYKSSLRGPEQEYALNTIKELNEHFNEQEASTALAKQGPKLRGLPGEYAWTEKDKDGFVEKLYEYETDFDTGDTIRRVRQYSVFYDKDCLLDVSSSTTLVQNTIQIDLPSLRNRYINKCITSSQAFQNFLRNNEIIVFTGGLSAAPQLTY